MKRSELEAVSPIHLCLLLGMFSDPTCRVTLSALHFPEIIFFVASLSYLQNYHTCLFILFVSPLYAVWVPPHTHTHTRPPPKTLYSIHSRRFAVGLVFGGKKKKQLKRILNRVYLIFSVRSVADSDFQTFMSLGAQKRPLWDTKPVFNK